MEILRAEVSSPYWMHLEDDWEFFAPDAYVSRAIAILEDDPSIGQVLFNRNYAELVSERDIPGGELKTTARGKQPYRVHIHAEPGTEAFEIFNRDIGKNRPTNAWWPNFSFRPSMMRTSAINQIGAFSTEPIHFELEFAKRFTAAGLRSAFFDNICNVNIGTLTTETGPNRRPNAYELNGEPQFGRPLPQTETTTVRLVSFWGDPTFLASHFSRQTKGDDEWNGIRLTDDPDADVTVVLNHPTCNATGPSFCTWNRSQALPHGESGRTQTLTSCCMSAPTLSFRTSPSGISVRRGPNSVVATTPLQPLKRHAIFQWLSQTKFSIPGTNSGLRLYNTSRRTT